LDIDQFYIAIGEEVFPRLLLLFLSLAASKIIEAAASTPAEEVIKVEVELLTPASLLLLLSLLILLKSFLSIQIVCLFLLGI
jgi:hypothetical protein